MLSPTPWRKKKTRVADAPLRKQRAPRRKRKPELPPLDWMMEDSHSANNVPDKSPAPPAVETRAVHEQLNDEPRVAPEEAYTKEPTPEPPVAVEQLVCEPASTHSSVWGASPSPVVEEEPSWYEESPKAQPTSESVTESYKERRAWVELAAEESDEGECSEVCAIMQ